MSSAADTSLTPPPVLPTSPRFHSRPIRVAYLITDLKTGGVPLHLYRLVTRLPSAQVQARVISLGREGPVSAMLRRAGVPVLDCGATWAGDWRALQRLWQILAADPPDIVHSLLFHANIAARVVAPLAGVPSRRILCEIQTVERERKWHLLVDGLTGRLCRYEVGNSPSVIEHLHRAAYFPRERLALEWGAVDVSAVQLVEPMDRRELGVGGNESLVLWSGRLDPVKGFEQMIPAMAAVAKRVPAKFVLAGDGAYRPVVERLIRDHAAESVVTLLGERQDIPRLLRAADAFLFCSMTEGLPNSVLEAMAAGLPIVATDVPGCRDLIQHRTTGLLVPYGNVPATIDAMSEVLQKRDPARRLGANALDWVRQNADLTLLPQRWVRRYEQVMARGGCP